MSKYADFTARIRKAPARTAVLAAGAGLAIALSGTGVANAAAPAAQPQALKAATVGNGWVSPVSAPFTFTGTYNAGGALWAAKHSGQDFAAPTGTAVKAASTGTVVTTGWGGAYGNQIVIRHANGMYTQYAHLSQINVVPGQSVTAGNTIGLIGSTGNSTGPHLHFEVRTTPYYGSSVNPITYLNGKGVWF